MFMSLRETDPFGYPADEAMQTEMMGLTPAAGWYACYKYNGAWLCRPFPMFMTVKRRRFGAVSDWMFDSFGVELQLGQLERIDTTHAFYGYAHESEFLERGAVLRPEAIERLEDGEFMCADPSRVEVLARLVSSDDLQAETSK